MSTCHSDDSGRRNLSPRSPPGLALAGAVGGRRDSSSQTPRNDGVDVLVPVITPTPRTVIPTTPLTVIPTTPLTVIPTTPGGGISALAAHPVLRLPGQWAGEEIPRRRLLGMTVWTSWCLSLRRHRALSFRRHRSLSSRRLRSLSFRRLREEESQPSQPTRSCACRGSGRTKRFLVADSSE